MAIMDVGDEQGPDWQEGKFQILFVSIGQGDCCVITCPDGAHIMVDCGSKAFESEGMDGVKALIRGDQVLGRKGTQSDRLAALILTHFDKDHINKVNYMIGGRKNALPIEEVYFSDTVSRPDDLASAPLVNYGAGGCRDTLYNYSKVQALYCVTLRRGAQILHKWDPPFRYEQHSIQNDLIAKNRVTVRQDWIDLENSWEVSIIAGNVLRNPANDHSDTDGRNAASLVTLVRFNDQRVLICGDATASTQDYLYNTFKNTKDIKSVEVLHVPHHGSSFTALTDDFINLVKPTRVVISVKSEEHQHHLPGLEVIDAFIPLVNATKEARRSRAWQQLEATAFNKLANTWVEGKKKGTIDFKERRNRETGVSRYTRIDVNDDTKEILLDGIRSPGTKYVLYQRQISSEIMQTGLDHNRWVYLPD